MAQLPAAFTGASDMSVFSLPAAFTGALDTSVFSLPVAFTGASSHTTVLSVHVLRARTRAILQQIEEKDDRLLRCCKCRNGLPQLPVSCAVVPVVEGQYLCLFCAVTAKVCPNRCPPNAVPRCDWFENIHEFVGRPELYNSSAITTAITPILEGLVCALCHAAPLSWWPDECNACHSRKRSKKLKKRKRKESTGDDDELSLLPYQQKQKRLRQVGDQPLILPIEGTGPAPVRVPDALVQQIVNDTALTVTERNRLIGNHGNGVESLLKLEQENNMDAMQIELQLRVLEQCHMANRPAQWLARCLKSRLLALHKRDYTGSTAWERVVRDAKWSTEPYRLLELHALIIKHPGFSYWSPSLPWRSMRDRLSEIRKQLDQLKLQFPGEYVQRWSVRNV